MDNRDLDNWIATHIMGPPKWEESASSHSLRVELNYSVPRYTESISDAFQVVGKMKDKGFDFYLHYRDATKDWWACFGKIENAVIYFEEGQNKELIICLAAKKAVEG